MKKIDKIFIDVDKAVDKEVNPFWRHFKKYFPIFSTIFLSLLIIFFVLRIFHNKPYFTSSIIRSDLKKIVYVLELIDRDCNVLGIENEKNDVNFLNISKFSGSEIGGLNLDHPEKWNGPYVMNNPTFKGRFYQIVKTREGNFVVPGDGVKLPNGLKIGKDFKITYDSSIPKMMEKGKQLNYKGQFLAIPLKFKVGYWDKFKSRKIKLEEINSMLEEFNAAMPFTYNDQNIFMVRYLDN